ncbi:MAG: hypothetical protein ACRDH8_00205 [Actinomycetota bacterium]
MPLTEPRDSTIAIVGDGFGSILTYATAIYLGFSPEQLTVYGPNDNPVSTYHQYAFNLGQTVLRSESESHFLPADWPTFAQLDAWSRGSFAPLFRSIRRKYNPGVPDILSEAVVVARDLGWNANRYPHKVGWLQREHSPTDHFVLYDEEANYVGRARHVMLTVGHGPLSFPPLLARAREDPRMRDRIVQAYEPKAYAPGGRYVVIGAGIASVNEWANAIDAGAKVVSLLRSPHPDEQDLNTPRCFFEARGIDAFQGLPYDQRIAFLGTILKGTSPRRRGWEDRIRRATSEGRFEQLIGEVARVEPGPAGLRIHVTSRHGPDPGWLDVTGVIAGTGFVRSVLAIPLLRRLIEFYDLPIEEGRLRLTTSCGLPGLDVPNSRICMNGIYANPVVPNGDTIAGLKYIARRFVADCARAERLRPRPFLHRFRMQRSLAGATAEAIRRARRMEQIA